MIRSRLIVCILCLLAAGTGYLSAGSPKKVRADKNGVRESAPAELISKKRQADGKVTFKFRIVRYKDNYTMVAKILRNDSSVYVMSPGVRLVLSDGGSVILKAERESACCSNWADGRWYNTTFKLSAADVDKLKSADVLSVFIPHYGGEINRKTAPGRESAIAERLRSVGED